MIKKALLLSALLMGPHAINAAPVALTWTTTLESNSNVPGSTIGEMITTTITVDNGGSSTASQTWSSADFLSYRVEGASGWWATSSAFDFASGVFATDAAGIVTSVGIWTGGWSTGAVLTSWAGAGFGGWWNNGANQVFCTDAFDCVWADNVQGNLDPANWSAALATTPVPVPASLPLLLAGIVGIAALRRKKA